MSNKRDYYEILGVSRSATPEEIKKSFRKKAKECHPDTNKSPEAEAQFKELGEAYDVLSDAQKRQVYDNYGHDGLKSGGYSPSWDFASGFPDLSDLFASFFGGGFGPSGFGGRGRYGPQRGNDIGVEVGLEFMEAVRGAQREVDISRSETCEPCQGSGASPGSGPTACTTCGGQGQIRQTTQTIIGHFTQITPCPRCQGIGQVVMDPCSWCQGQGRRAANKKLNITVPAGVDEGTRLRIGQEGESGMMGGPPGDLYVLIRVKQHPQFQRDGYDVISRCLLSYPELALGCEREIETVDGTERLKIPAGTQNGQVFTFKGKGIPVINQPNRRGNHYVQVEIQIPSKISGQEKRLLEQLRDLNAQVATHTTHAPKQDLKSRLKNWLKPPELNPQS
ncbi:MAG: molecular chaperone DnaJ [Cyanobacteria bacterium]|nr:molecular chaperone DnaJ [Cyanobacteriota bacterium]